MHFIPVYNPYSNRSRAPVTQHQAENTPRLQVGVHVLAPAEALAANPLPGAVAVMQLAVAASAARSSGVQLPEGAARLAVFVDGTESEQDLSALKVGRSPGMGCRRRLP